jgi:hypothetical protein
MSFTFYIHSGMSTPASLAPIKSKTQLRIPVPFSYLGAGPSICSIAFLSLNLVNSFIATFPNIIEPYIPKVRPAQKSPPI